MAGCGLRSAPEQERVVTAAPRADSVGEGIDSDVVKTAVRQALANGPVPRYEDLVALDAELREHIEQLLPSAQERVNALWRGSADQYSRQGFLNAASYLLTSGLGDGLASAVHHVQHLARTCQTLLEYSRDAS
jgi:hypothetical protein